MATLERLVDALRQADAAGNKEDAQALADAIRQMKVEPPRETTVAEGLARGMSPYVGGMGAGALVGGAVGGLVGGPPGALAGATLGARAVPIALGIQDIGTQLYNVIAPRFGGGEVRPLSEGIKEAAESVGIGRPGAPIAEAIGGGAAGAGTQALALTRSAPALVNTLAASRAGASGVDPMVLEGVRNAMAAQPATQALAGGLGGAAAGTLQSAGETNPITLMLAGLGGAAATPAAISGIRAANTALTNRLPAILDPLGMERMRLAEGRAPQIIQELRATPVSETGAPLMTAQASVGAKAPAYAAAMDEAAKLEATRRLSMLEAQERARQGALAAEAGTPAERAALITARDKQAKEMFGSAFSKRVREDETLTELFKTPAMRDVLRVAREISANRQEPFQFGETRAARTVETGFVGPGGENLRLEMPAEFAVFPVKNLYTVKKAMDDLITDPARFGIGAEQVNAVRDVRTNFMNWLENKVPDVKKAREAYAEASLPINQRAGFETLREALSSPLEAGERSTAYANAVKALTSEKDAPKALRRLIDNAPRYQKLEDFYPPEKIEVIDAVRLDLARDAQLKRLVQAGQTAAGDVTKIGTRMTGEKGLPNTMDQTVALFNRLIAREKGRLNQRLAMELALESLNPKVAAEALERSMKRQAKFERFRLPEPKPLSQEAFGAATLPVLTNAFNPQENRNAMVR